MISKAKASYVRMSERKVRYVIDLIRRQSVNQSLSILDRTPRAATRVVKKLLLSAVDAAEKNASADRQNLYVSKVTADGAGMLKRWRAMSMGRAGQIRKRMSHIQIELDQIAGKSKGEAAKQAAPARKAKAGAKQKKAVGASK